MVTKLAKSTQKQHSSVGPKITATSETTRFHVDTLSTLSQEIDLKKVGIAVGDNDLLVDAHLRLKEGVHYALVGRNGEGKTTLLKAIADRLIPGLPDNFHMLLVSQVDEQNESVPLVDEYEHIPYDSEFTVTECVVKSDRRRERALAEEKVLAKALESASTPVLAKAVTSVRLIRARDELEEARKIAQRRSGARGAEARKQLLIAEKKVSDLEEMAESADWTEGDDVYVSAGNELFHDVQNTLDALGAKTTEARARSILLGLGFSQEQLDAKFRTLSSGWRSRCSLANALLQQPHLLMLDEPTNYLDLMSVIWLQTYLEELPSTVLVIAHDREFVDTVAQETIILRQKTLTYFDGNMTEYERHARIERKGKIRQKEAMDKKKSAIEKSIEIGKRSAQKTGDENRLRMVKSRQRKLDDRWGIERNEKGQRFKRNRDMIAYHTSSRMELVIEELDPPIKLSFPDPEPLRFPGALISAAAVSFAYPGVSKLVLSDVNMTIHPGARVGLVGRNGEGKSTLVKLLIGALIPHRGTIERHPRLRLGYFDQHTVDTLSAPGVARVSAYTYFVEQAKERHSIDVSEQEGRSFLGTFGLGHIATNPIGTLSGGQKVRLALALVVYPAPDLLVLDEATTHLDKDTITAFIYALRRYTGAILLVSHDRHFTRCVIEGAPILPPSDDLGEDEEESDDDSDEDDGPEKTGVVYAVGPKGKVKPLSGGTDDYVTLVEKRMKKLGLIDKN